MPRQTWIAEACRDWGLTVRETVGWQTRGDTALNPAGIICHHTGGPASGELPELPTLINGRPDLPGPLCHVGLGRSGTVYVVAAGRANHAGVGEWRGARGNSAFLGIEPANNGVQGWPDMQIEAYVLCCAALCDGIGCSADMVAGHKEYALPPGRKPDPHGIDMAAFRGRVHQTLGTGGHDMTPDQERLLVHIGIALGVSPTDAESDVRAWAADLHRELVSCSPQPPGSPQNGVGKMISGIANGTIVVSANAHVTVDPVAIAAAIVAQLGPTLAAQVAEAVIDRTAVQYAKP